MSDTRTEAARELEAWADDRDKCSDRAAILGHGEGKP